VLTHEHEHVDHLLGGLGLADLHGDRLPELIEAFRPGAALALLVQRQGPSERARLAHKQLEIVVQPCADR
jgi:hypothetical protein